MSSIYPLETDDNAESIMKRFITYRLQTQPIIEVITPFAPKFVQHFEKNGLCTHVDGNQEEDRVFDDIKADFRTRGLICA